MRFRSLAPMLPLVLLLPGCEGPSDGGPPEPVEAAAPTLSVYTAAYPLKYFAERIGGDRTEVVLPVPAGVDPAEWSPGPEVILGYQEADLIFLNGAEYESWTGTASLPPSRVVDTSQGFTEELIHEEGAVTHSHGPEGEHSHGETGSVTWLDPGLAIRQAEAIRDALIEADPDGAAAFQAGYLELETDLMAVDRELDSALDGARSRPLLAASPSYSYLARRYGVEILGFPFDPENPLDPDFWHEVEHGLSHGAARVMLWESAPPERARERMTELGIEPVVFDPAGAEPHGRSFLQVMNENATGLVRALESGATGP